MSDRKQSGLLFALGMAVMVMGLAFCWLLLRGYWAAKRFDSWIPTSARVTAAWIDSKPQPGAEPPRLSFEVRYAYRVGGREYVGTRVKEIPGNTRARSKVEKLANRFPIGSEVTCFVNPRDPEVAILIRPTKAPGYTLWFPGLFAVGGAGMCVVAMGFRRGDR